VHSGSEKKVVQTIQEQAQKKGLADKFSALIVPCESVVEIRRGVKVNVEKKFFPGYILVKMEMTDETWYIVKENPKVTKFLGAKDKPIPISEAEALRIQKQIDEGIEKPRSLLTFETGEHVKVAAGPFANFYGIVEEVDEEKTRLRVAVSIFGRSTPVEVEFNQVEKIQDKEV
jgi:transcriptional antiterminator NusG